MSRLTSLVASSFLLGLISLSCAAAASAGNYYVYACSSYGNTAPAFAAYSNADHLNTANECMQPAPGGGRRSLEISDPSGASVLHRYGANWTATTPSSAVSIIGAYTPSNTVFADCNLNADGFTAEYFWSSGTQAINYINYCGSDGYGFGTGINISFAPSSYFGWGAGCWLKSSCSTSSSAGAVLGVQGVRLTAQENSGPSVVADGSNNLWYQGSHWVRGGGWPVTFTTSDPSGVCGTDLLINGQFTGTDNTNDGARDTASFTQCWPTDTATGTLDIGSFPNGPLTIEYAANNAASVVSGPTETLQVDNTPVNLALATPSDPDPNAWVNHAVQVVANASSGPSGIGGTSCSTNSGASYAYPSGGIALDGTGIWNVSCSSWNNAFDVNGQPASSPVERVAVHIDETAPTATFEPVDPSDPQAVVVDTSDGQSGVAGGQIQMRPATGGAWQSLATQFDGSRLLARFNDAVLAPGSWVIEANSCDHAGNCTTADETLALPVRSASVSNVSFEKLMDPLRTHVISERIRIGWHWAALKRGGKRVRVKRGGHILTVRVRTYIRRCATDHVKVGRHRRRERNACQKPQLLLKRQERSQFGKTAVLHGLLSTGQGAPIADVPVSILTAPNDGLAPYGVAASVRTGSDGTWSVTLPPGPSRLVEAVHNGSPTIQPSRGSATLVVPASVKVLRVWPRHIPWGGKVHIKARLLGGFLPPGGALVRLRLGYGNARITYGVQEHVGGNGTFVVTNTFGPGPLGLIRHYWLQECTLPEGDYPFAPACGLRSGVTVGGSGP